MKQVENAKAVGELSCLFSTIEHQKDDFTHSQYRLGSNIRDISAHLELCICSGAHDFDQILVI